MVCRAEEILAPGAVRPGKCVAVKQISSAKCGNFAELVKQEHEMLQTLADKPYTVEYYGMFAGKTCPSSPGVPCAYLVMG